MPTCQRWREQLRRRRGLIHIAAGGRRWRAVHSRRRRRALGPRWGHGVPSGWRRCALAPVVSRGRWHAAAAARGSVIAAGWRGCSSVADGWWGSAMAARRRWHATAAGWRGSVIAAGWRGCSSVAAGWRGSAMAAGRRGCTAVAAGWGSTIASRRCRLAVRGRRPTVTSRRWRGKQVTGRRRAGCHRTRRRPAAGVQGCGWAGQPSWHTDAVQAAGH